MSFDFHLESYFHVQDLHNVLQREVIKLENQALFKCPNKTLIVTLLSYGCAHA